MPVPIARPAQMRAQPVTVGIADADHVLVKHVAAFRPARRQIQRQPGKPGIVARGDCLPARIVGIETRQFRGQDRGLDRVQPRVDPDPRADVTLAPAIFADFAQRSR